VDELMQKGPGRFKQLLDTAGLHREAEDVLKMFITKEPWKCTTDVELKVTKAIRRFAILSNEFPSEGSGHHICDHRWPGRRGNAMEIHFRTVRLQV